MTRDLTEDLAFCRSVLASRSAYLNDIVKQPDATIRYNDFAEAMYWTDELPKDAPPEVRKCHFILIYLREFVVFEQGNLSIDALIEEFRLCAGDWAFLSSERFSPSLQKTYRSLYDAAGERMAEEFERLERRERPQKEARKAKNKEGIDGSEP